VGDWSEAVMLELAYEHARTGEPKHIRQVVRIAPISRSSSRLANAPS
jgi:hypothetical protein